MALKPVSQMSSLSSSINSDPSSSSSSTLGYAQGLDKNKAKKTLQSQEFLQDVMDYYGELDGVSFATADEAIDHFMNDRRWSNMNSISMLSDMANSSLDSDAQNSRLARLQTTFEALPDFYEDGGDGWSGFATNAAAAILDPVNLVGFGAGGAAAKSAAAGVRATAGSTVTKAGMEKVKRDALTAGVKAGVKQGAVSEGALEAGISTGHSLITQNRDVNLGIQDEVSLTQAAVEGATGAALGGALGGVFGGVGAVAPSLKGDGNAITQGLREGQAMVRSDNAVARAAEADVADAGTPEEVEDLTPAQQATKRKQDLADSLNQRLDRMAEAELNGDDLPDTSFEAIGESARASDGVPTDNTRPITDTEAGRLAVRNMQDLDRLANEIDARADTESDVKKVKTLRRQAAEMRQRSDEYERVLMKVGDPAEPTVQSDIEQLIDMNAAERARVNEPAGDLPPPTTPEGDAVTDVDPTEPAALPAPTAVQGPRGVVDAGGNVGQVMMPDGSVSSSPEAKASIDIQQAELENETELEASLAAKEAELVELNARIEQFGNETVSEADPEAQSAKMQEWSDSLIRASELSNEILTERAQLNDARSARAESARAKSSQAVDSVDEPQLTDLSGRPVDKLESNADEYVEAEVEQELEDFEDVTPEAIAEEISTNMVDLLEVMNGLGFNAKYEERVLRGLGDGRTKQGREARKEYLIDRLKYARSREIVRGVMQTMDNTTRFNRLAVEAMIEVATDDAVEIGHAMSIYDRYVETKSMRIYADMLADRGVVANPTKILAEIRDTYGDVVADSVERTLSGGAQEVRFPAKDIRDLKATLPKEKQDAIGQIMSTYVNKIYESHGKMPEQSHIDAVADRLVIKYAFSDENGILDLAKYEKWGAGKIDDVDLAPHIGAQRRQGLGKYNANGKTVTGGDTLKRAQKMLQKANRFGYHGKLVERMTKRDEGGTARRMGGVATAMEELADSAIERASKSRMVQDPLKRQESIEAATSDIDDPEWLEARIAEDRKYRAAIKRLEKKKDEISMDDEEALIELEARIEANQTSLTELGNSLKAEFNFVNGIQDVKTRLKQLTTSAEKEAAGRRKEEMLANQAERILRETLMPQIREITAKLARHKRAIDNGSKSDITDTEAANLQAQLEKIASDIDKQSSNLPAAEKKAMAAMKANLRREYIANGYVNKSANDVPPTWTEEEVAQMEALFGPADESDYAFAKDLVDSEMRQEAAQIQFSNEVNEVIQAQDLDGMTKAELVAEIKKLQGKAQAKSAATTEPNTIPSGLKHKPRIVVTKDGIELDVNNDFKYSKAGDGSTTVSFNGENVASITKGADGFILRSLTSNAPAMLFKTKGDLVDYLPNAFRKRIKAANEQTYALDSYEGQEGLTYPIPDWTTSSTYAESEPVPTPVVTRDPVESPVVKGDESSPLTMTADNFDIPANKQLAIQIIDPTSGQKIFKSVRVSSYKTTQTVGEILRAASKYEYVIGTVDVPHKSGSFGAEETFRPINDGDKFYPVNADSPITGAQYKPKSGGNDRSSKRMRINRPAKLEAVANNPIDQSVLPESLQGLQIGETVGDLVNFVAALENFSWESLAGNGLESYSQFMRVRRDAGIALQTYIPNGIDKPQATRQVAIKQIRDVLAGYADDEVQAAEDFIMRVTTNLGFAPLIKGGPRTSYNQMTTATDSSVSNRITIGDNSMKVDEDGKRHTPVTADLVHEVGHWLYENAMDEADKLEFWGAMGKYIDEGGLNIDMLSKRTQDTRVYSNALQSPAEMFANQFQAWVIQNGQVNDMSLWKKISRMAVTLIKKIKGEDFEIDPDLIPIFQKYMPVLDIDPETGFSTGGVSRYAHLEDFGQKVGTKGGNGAAMAGRQMRILDEAIIELQSALGTSVPEMTDSLGLLMTIEKLHKRLYRDYGGKMGRERHSTKKGMEDTTGFTRILMLDKSKKGLAARSKLLNAQERLHNTLSALRAAGAYRTSGSDLIADIPDDEGRIAIAEALQENIESQMDGASDTSVYEAQLQALRSTRASYDGVSQEVVRQIRADSNDLIVAMDQAIEVYRGIFNRNMPKDSRGASVGVDKAGRATLKKPSAKSQLNARKQREAAKEEIDNFINMNLLVQAMNEADPSIFLDESAIADVALMPAPSSMSKAEIVTEASATDADNKRHVDMANEMRNRSNTEQKSIEEVMADLSDEELEVITNINSVDVAQRVLKAAMDSGNAKFIRIASHYLQNNGVEMPAKPKSKEVVKAVEELTEAAVGTDSANGIRHGLSSANKDILGGLTNRDKRVEFIQRDLATRLFTLINKAGENDYVSENDIRRIVTGKAGDPTDPTVAQLNGESYDAFRKIIRRTSARMAAGDRAAISDLIGFTVNTMTDEAKKIMEPVAELTGMSVNDLVVGHVFTGEIDLMGMDNEIPRLSNVKRIIKDMSEKTTFLASGLQEGGADQSVMLAAHGDIFAMTRPQTPNLSASRSLDVKNMHPSIAIKATREFINTMPKRIETAVREFIGVNHAEDLNNHVFFNHAPSDVRGVTYTDGGDYGSGVYLKTKRTLNSDYDPVDFDMEMEELIFSANLTGEQTQMANELVSYIKMARERISQGGMGVEHALRVEARHWRLLKELVPTVSHNKVAPVFASIDRPFKITSSERYTLVGNKGNNIAYLLQKMAKSGLFNAKGAEILRDGLPSSFSGRDLYQALVGNSTTGRKGVLVEHGNASDVDDAKEILSNMLEEYGFDSIETDDGFVMFDESSVREVTRPFRESDLKHYGEEKTDLGIAGEAAIHMATTGETINKDNFIGLTVQAQMAGIPDAALKPLKRMAKGRELGASDVERVSVFSSAMNYFAENSQRFRNMGATWFGNKLKPKKGLGVFEKHDSQLAEALNPLLIGDDPNSPSLRNLSDTKTGLKRWMQRNRGLMLSQIEQPASHRRILDALRRGKGAVARLEPKERAVAYNIAKAFEKELQRMRDLGIKVGDTRKYGLDFYVPQVWDKEAILSNPNQFIEGITNFFIREQRKPDYVGAIEDVPALRARAEKIFNKMAESDEGVLDLSGADVKKAVSDPMYRRMLTLQPEDFGDLDGFLVNDLEGLVTKYFDRTVRKRILTQEFGLSGHGIDTYQIVSTLGAEGAVDVLMRDTVQRLESNSVVGKISVEDVSIPRIKGSREDIETLLRRVKTTLGDTAAERARNKEAAIAILINAQEGPMRDNPQFVVRVEAVVNAMSDFPNGGANRTLNKKIEEFTNVLNKRPIDGSHGSETKHKVSRSLRAFNSVSLLGYTTLSSLPDLALPLIRSGNMGAFARAWSKYTTDPAYRRMSKNIGTGIENLMHDRMVQMAGEGNQRFSNAFFNATGLTPWTSTMREVAGMVGMESFKAEIERALKMRAAGNTNSNAYKTAVRFLERYGLTGEGADHDFLRAGSFRIDAIPEKNEVVRNQMRAAILRFTNEAIFTPNPNDVPMWAQTPVGAVFFQLKSFPLMMARLSKDVLKEARQGNLKPLMYLVTAGVGMGAGANAIKDIVQARGGEDDQSSEIRDRSLTSVISGFGGTDEDAIRILRALGFTGGTTKDADKALGIYIEGLLAMGGLGLFAELLYNSAAQIDNGAYGYARFMSNTLGPSVGLTQNAFNIGAGLADMNESNSKERTAARDVISRIPFVGGYRPLKEGLVDMVAGKKQEKGSSWSDSWGKGSW